MSDAERGTVTLLCLGKNSRLCVDLMRLVCVLSHCTKDEILCCVFQQTDMGSKKYCLSEDLSNPTLSVKDLFAYRDGCQIKFSSL